jgi:carbonic anhydrase/acetyltransferase-like protein (isoleucine patch superfamily)
MPIHPFQEHYPTVAETAWVAPGAQLIGRVTLAPQASVWYNAVLRADDAEIRVGARSNIQDNSTVHVDFGHPATIGEDVTIGHGVTIHACTVEHQVLVGINAVLLTGCQIGWGSIIGANALVTEGKAIPPRSLVLGSPGRVVREVTDEELQWLLRSAGEYVKRAAQHRASHPNP